MQAAGLCVTFCNDSVHDGGQEILLSGSLFPLARNVCIINEMPVRALAADIELISHRGEYCTPRKCMNVCRMSRLLHTYAVNSLE